MNKFNEHILLVMRWLQNNDSVSKKELLISYDDARAVMADRATAVYDAAHDAVYDAAAAVKHWLTQTNKYLSRYFELTKEDRQAYENRAKHLNILGANCG